MRVLMSPAAPGRRSTSSLETPSPSVNTIEPESEAQPRELLLGIRTATIDTRDHYPGDPPGRRQGAKPPQPFYALRGHGGSEELRGGKRRG